MKSSGLGEDKSHFKNEVTFIIMCCLSIDFVHSFLPGFNWVIVLFLSTVVMLVSIVVVSRLLAGRMSTASSNLTGYEEQWFGRGQKPLETNDIEEYEDFSIRPFKIEVSEDILSDLKSRLKRTRFEEPVEDSKFLYGFNPNYLKKLVDYWIKDYDWRKQERMFNQFPQFKTRIEGIDVHFVHVKPDLSADLKKLKIIPLMVVHGWPGCVSETHKLIPLLTAPHPNRDFVFELVCPSLPGFGFSESPHQKGFSARAAARFLIKLMDRIGHRQFYVQGGDWGSVTAQLMARYYPSRILGLHMNIFCYNLRPWEAIKLLFIAMFPRLVSKDEYRASSLPLHQFLKMVYSEGGYYHLQCTKPDTLGCAMADSPAGLAAYLLEKFSYATNPKYIDREDGGLTKEFMMDDLLTVVILCWINNNFSASARFYKENMPDIFMRIHEKVPVVVPSAVAVFPHEVLMLPKTCMSQQMKNMVSYTIMPRGGHFAALQEPELLANDICKFISLIEK